MTTIRDVARAAGASTATVSHVLNGSRFVAAETKERVQRAILALNYRPHGVARSLRRSRTSTIGVLISDIANPFFADLVLGVEDVIHRDVDSYNFILCNTEENSEKERMYLEVLLQKRVDGIILASAGGNVEAIQNLVAEGLPLVCVDREVDKAVADTIVIDNYAAALSLVRHLVAVKRRRIAVLRANLNAKSIEQRIAGYRAALAEASLAPWPGTESVAESTVDDACRAARALLGDAAPDAIFCTNNFMTLGAMRAIAELGLNCPGDVAIAGIDDLPWTAGFRPRLTVVAQPARRMGREAATLLLDRIAKRRVEPPGYIVLPTELYVRESCGATAVRDDCAHRA
jgi:LacI family transcriptional regulator